MRSSAPIRPANAASLALLFRPETHFVLVLRTHPVGAEASSLAQAGREESAEKNGESYERSGDAICRP
jgi:hypothetical protein